MSPRDDTLHLHNQPETIGHEKLRLPLQQGLDHQMGMLRNLSETSNLDKPQRLARHARHRE